MKELSIEEKAKRYDEAIRESSKIINHCTGGANIPECVSVKATIEQIFPELKESEDERIRKALIDWFSDTHAVDNFKGIAWERIVAWLEKQADKDEEILILKDKIESLHAAIKAIKETHRIELEKQGEQKLYVNDNAKEMFIKALERVEELNNKGYKLTDCDKNSWWEDFKAYTSCIIGQKPADIRTTGYWHVEDIEQKPAAKYKVGDTIYYNSFGRLVSFVIANIVEDGTDNPMYEDKDGNSVFQNDIIEQKSAWSEEDKYYYGIIQYILNNECVGKTDKEEAINWFKSLKDRVQIKQEWKQENTDDLTDFENAMMHIGGSFFGENAGLDPNNTNAIKEQANLLLELVPKQEWSEEDETMIKVLDSIIRYIVEIVDKDALEKFGTNREELFSWLKSLIPQNTWKPSDEQIEILDMVLSNESMDDNIARILRELREQLKKLREE